MQEPLKHPDDFTQGTISGKLSTTAAGANNEQQRNDLEFNEEQLRSLASSIRAQGLTSEQLRYISGEKLTGNPWLSQIMWHAGDDLQRKGADILSFNRGAILALHLIDGSAVDGMPIVDVGSAQLTMQSQHADTESLRAVLDRLLDSQPALNEAFDTALPGLPPGTIRDIARLGGGVILLSALNALST